MILESHIRPALFVLAAQLLKRIELVNLDAPINMRSSHQRCTARSFIEIIWSQLKLRELQTCDRLRVVIYRSAVVSEVLVICDSIDSATVESDLGLLHFGV